MPSPDPLFLLRGCSQPITALGVINQSESGIKSALVTGTQTGDIHVWDLKTRRIVESKEGVHSGGILSIHYQNNRVLTQGRDGVIKKWNWSGNSNFDEIGEIQYTCVGFCPMMVIADFIIVTSDQSPGQLDLRTADGRGCGRLRIEESTERKYGMAMVARRHNESIFVGYEDGSVVIWNSSTFNMCHRLKLHDDAVMALDVSQKTPRGISASVDCKIQIWTWNEQFEISLFKSIEITNPGVNSIRIRSDDKIFVCACWDNSVRVFSMKKYALLALLNVHKDAIRCLEFDESNFLYVGSDDQIVSAWGIYQ